MFRWKRVEIAAALALLITLACSAVYMHTTLQTQTAMAEKMVRLHVLANSDSETDQQRKLLVKDAVSARTEELLRLAEDQQEAELLLEHSLPELQELAMETLADNGRAEDVRVSLVTTRFSTRYYDGFTLPAGKYRSLQVVIGEGKGQNWWCVVFPPLCSAGQEELSEAASRAGFSAEEIDLIRRGEREYLLRFRSIELWNRLWQFLTENGYGA